MADEAPGSPSRLEQFLGEGPWYVLVSGLVENPADPGEYLFQHPLTVTGSAGAEYLAVFTDAEAAEQFCDERAPDKQIISIPTLALLAAALHGLRAVVAHVMRDPYRPGYNAITAPIAALLGEG